MPAKLSTDKFDIHETAESITIIFSSTMENIDRTCDEALKFLVRIFKDHICQYGENIRGEDSECYDCFKSHLFAIQLVMREGLTNAVRHGNSLNASKTVTCSVKINSDLLLRMEIEDQGDGFNWREEQRFKTIDETSDHGRGLMIMEQYFSKYWYNESGNKLMLEKSVGLK